MSGHLLLPGANGDYVSAPFSAAYNTTGSVDIRADIEPATVSGTQYVMSRLNGVDNLWRVGLSDTSFSARFLDGSSTQENVSVSSPITTARWQARWVLDFGESEFRAYLRSNTNGGIDLSSDSGWSLNDSPDAITITDLKEGNDPIHVGATGAAGVSAFNGKMYRAQLWHGTDNSGTLVFDGDPADPATWNCPDKDSFTEKANDAIVTLQGDTELVGDCPTTGNGNRMGGSGAIRRRGGARH